MTSVVALTELLNVTVTPAPGSVQDVNMTELNGAPVSASNPLPVSTKANLAAQAPTSASVGVTSAQVVAANVARKGLVLTNNSTANISIAFDGNAAVSGSGIVLYPGGVFFMDEYMFTTASVNAIATAAASNLGVQEWV